MDITADKVELKGVATQGLFRSSLESRTTGDGSSARAGDITLKTRILNITDAALISTTTFNSGRGGDINLTAQESMVFSGTGTFFDGQAIRSGLSLQTNNLGAGGNLKILNTGTVQVLNGALISSIASGQGNAGNIDIDADTVEIGGISLDLPFRSELSSGTINENSSANAGNTTIKTRILNVRDGGLIRTDTENSGKGGNLTISARESMNFIGTATLTDNRFIRSGLSLQTRASGSAGNLRIFDTGAIQVEDGALISTISTAQGNAGNIDISADSLELLGFSTDKQFRSALSSQTIGQDSSANAGNIILKTRNLSIRDGAAILTETFNQGRGGNLTVTATESLQISGAPSFPEGGFWRSALSTLTQGTGEAGNLRIIDTGLIKIEEGAGVFASSIGQGKGGNINIAADSVELRGASANGQFLSFLGSETTGVNSRADAGDVTIAARNLNIRDGARISTQTFNQGRGGNLTINARESLNIFGTGVQNGQVVGSGFFTETSASGDSGDLRIIDTGSIRIEGGGTISASNRGQGSGGNIEINADTLEIFGIASNGQFVSAIGSETTGANSSTDAGDITITARNLNISDRGLISTRSFNQGKAGNININVDKTLNLTMVIF
ncbi:MAG: S-layer family protein [Richelia sp. RM2_1_2]|nr:S-layer family protein [Richelia sp. RM2_1_2]